MLQTPSCLWALQRVRPPHLSFRPFLPPARPAPADPSDSFAPRSFWPPYRSLSPLYTYKLPPSVTYRTDLKGDLRILLIELLRSENGKRRPEVMKWQAQGHAVNGSICKAGSLSRHLTPSTVFFPLHHTTFYLALFDTLTQDTGLRSWLMRVTVLPPREGLPVTVKKIR